MKPKIKRIVAREGLIILSLLFLAGVSFFLDWWSNSQKQRYYADVQEFQPIAGPWEYYRESANAKVTYKTLIDPFDPKTKDIEDFGKIDKFDVQGALKAGYSEKEIAEYLSNGKYSSLEGGILQFPKNTKEDVIKQTIKRDFPSFKGSCIVWDSPSGKDILASYDKKGERVFNSFVYKINFAYAYIFFLILAYPLYLLARFVAWALWTLRQKQKTE